MKIEKALGFEDVVLIPKYSELETRKGADTKVCIGNNVFKLPVSPSNMVCTINEDLGKLLSENMYFYVMHRFGDTHGFVKRANEENWKFISISVGVREKCDKILDQLKEQNLKVDSILIDVAHGHHLLVKEAIKKIKRDFPDTFVIAGNVTTKEGTQDLKDWGADMVKVAIGTGKACITKDKTGFTLPVFTCIQECAEIDIPIMADGGVRCHGDIAKSIVAGSTINMIGSMFAACSDSPADTIVEYPVTDSKSDPEFKKFNIYKKYFGSASYENKVINNLSVENIEGTTILVEENGKTYLQMLSEIEQDLQSSISYSGGYNITDLSHTNYRII
jgi:GMP reductase